MTGEEFRSTYELGEPVGRGRVTSFRARTSEGEKVMVHFLTGSADLDRPVLDRLEALDETLRSEIHRRLEVDGRPVVVTVRLPDFESFESWLDRAEEAGIDDATEDEVPASPDPPAAGSAAEPPTSASEGDDSRPGEFTRLFEAYESEQETTSPSEDLRAEGPEEGGQGAPSSKEPPPREPPATEPPASDAPAGGAAVGDAPAEDPSSADASAEEPGEFTRLFRMEDVTGEAAGDEAPEGERSEGDARRSGAPSDAGGGAVEPRDSEPSRPGRPERERGPEGRGGPAETTDDPGAGASERPQAPPPGAPPPPPPEDSPSSAPPEGSDPSEPGRPSERSGGREPRSAGGDARDRKPRPGDSAGSEGPGEFTRLFGAADAPTDPPADDLQYGGDPGGGSSRETGRRGDRGGRPGGERGGGGGSEDYLSRLNEAPDEPRPSSSGPAPPPASQPASQPGASSGGRSDGPGEFTRIVRGDDLEKGGAPAAPSSAPGTASPSSSTDAAQGPATWVWVVGLGGVVLAAVLLVVLVLVLS